MRNPWIHDVEDSAVDTDSDAAGARNVVRLGVALWLLVGVAALGLYLGWSAAPRQYEAEASVADRPGLVVESEAGSLTVLLPLGGRHFGFAVDAAGPRLDVVVADDRIEVFSSVSWVSDGGLHPGYVLQSTP